MDGTSADQEGSEDLIREKLCRSPVIKQRLAQIPNFKIYRDLFYISAMRFDRRNG